MTHTCAATGKRCYRSRDVAKRVAKKRGRACGDVIRAYACDRCTEWHIGHPPGTEAMRRERARWRQVAT